MINCCVDRSSVKLPPFLFPLRVLYVPFISSIILLLLSSTVSESVCLHLPVHPLLLTSYTRYQLLNIQYFHHRLRYYFTLLKLFRYSLSVFEFACQTLHRMVIGWVSGLSETLFLSYCWYQVSSSIKLNTLVVFISYDDNLLDVTIQRLTRRWTCMICESPAWCVIVYRSMTHALYMELANDTSE